jgi:hypothetical protein
MASLLELDYDDVPHFAAMGDRWWIEWTNWLADRGWRIGNAWYSVDLADPTKLDGWTIGYWLASVTSLRTRPDGTHIGHLVVMRDGQIAWDPHPRRDDGHLGFTQGELLIPIDPARFVYRRDD